MYVVTSQCLLFFIYCLCWWFFWSLIHSFSFTHTVFSPWRRHQWGVCTLRRCWHRACRSTWCTRASHPSSRISSRAGCRGSRSSRSGRSWWRWDSSWDLWDHKWLWDSGFSSLPTQLGVSFRHQMETVLLYLTLPIILWTMQVKARKKQRWTQLIESAFQLRDKRTKERKKVWS